MQSLVSKHHHERHIFLVQLDTFTERARQGIQREVLNIILYKTRKKWVPFSLGGFVLTLFALL